MKDYYIGMFKKFDEDNFNKDFPLLKYHSYDFASIDEHNKELFIMICRCALKKLNKLSVESKIPIVLT